MCLSNSVYMCINVKQLSLKIKLFHAIELRCIIMSKNIRSPELTELSENQAKHKMHLNPGKLSSWFLIQYSTILALKALPVLN